MEQNIGREPQKDNDLFYTCSLIDLSLIHI